MGIEQKDNFKNPNKSSHESVEKMLDVWHMALLHVYSSFKF